MPNSANSLATHQSLTMSRVEHQFQDLCNKILDQGYMLVCHYYAPELIQDLAKATGGIVSDSLEMARAGARSSSKKLIVSGVRFMAESAKILSYDKEVFSVDNNATCSLDIGCDPQDFKAFKKQYPDHTTVVYANTSAAIKAQADWVVTSSIAVPVVEHILDQGKQIIWAPDKHLGQYINKTLDANMVLWDSSCIVHDEFKATELAKLKNVYPDAGVLVHPESPIDVIELGDFVGSTSQIIKAAEVSDKELFIIASDKAMIHEMRRVMPSKKFIEAPTAGEGSQCRSCARCPWMSLNTLDALERFFEHPEGNRIELDRSISELAYIPMRRMMDFQVK